MKIFGLGIQSHTSGRIRLRDLKEQVNLSYLAEQLLQSKLIVSYKANHLAHSILIHYDATHYPSKKWLRAVEQALKKMPLEKNSQTDSKTVIFSKTSLRVCTNIH